MTPGIGRFAADLRSARRQVRHDHPDQAARLLTALWRRLPKGSAPESTDRLREVTEDLGRRTSSPEVAAVFRDAGRYYAREGHHRLARRMGIYELAVWRARAHGEPTLREQTFIGYRDALHSLARIDRAVGRLHRVVNGLDELLELQVRHGLPTTVDAAWTLRELGAVMLQGNRPGTALRRYLMRADDLYTRLGESTAVIRGHAVCHVLTGQAHLTLDHPNQAWTSLHRARTLLRPLDPAAAADVNALIEAMATGAQPVPLRTLATAEFGLPAWPAPTVPAHPTT